MNALEINPPVISIESTIKEISSLISLPEIYLKFKQLMNNPKSTINQFCELVSCDPNLTASVLKIVNSAFFGFPGQIDSINRAIVMLGIGQLHDLVLADSTMSSLALKNDIVPLKTFWRANLFSGVLARSLGNQLNLRKSDSLFVAGLLHEIGHLIIYSKYPEQARIALDVFQQGNQMICAVEQKLLGLHYGQVGAKLMAQWHLPANLQTMTHYQPTPTSALEYQLETAILHVAHGYACKYFFETDLPVEKFIVSDVWKILDLMPEDIEITLETSLGISADLEKSILK